MQSLKFTLREQFKKLIPWLDPRRTSPEKASWSLAFGIGSIFLPFPGFQTPFLVLFGMLFGLNIPLIYISNWINNPVTMLPIAVIGLGVGLLVLPGYSISQFPADPFQAFGQLFWPFFWGSLILTFFVTLALYFPILIMVKKYLVHKGDLNREPLSTS